VVSLLINELLQRGEKGGFGFLYTGRIRYNLQFLRAVLEIFYVDIVIPTSESNCAYSSLRSASNSPFFLKVWRSESIMDRLVCDMGRSEGFNLLRGGITSANTCSSPSRERLRSTAAMLKKLIQERMCRVICEGDVGVTELATDIWPQGGARILRKARRGFAKSVPHRSLGVASPHLDVISKHSLSFICPLKVPLGSQLDILLGINSSVT
jgi:hypothetical protein